MREKRVKPKRRTAYEGECFPDPLRTGYLRYIPLLILPALRCYPSGFRSQFLLVDKVIREGRRVHIEACCGVRKRAEEMVSWLARSISGLNSDFHPPTDCFISLANSFLVLHFCGRSIVGFFC